MTIGFEWSGLTRYRVLPRLLGSHEDCRKREAVSNEIKKWQRRAFWTMTLTT
jgi:hypothetical protein